MMVTSVPQWHWPTVKFLISVSAALTISYTKSSHWLWEGLGNAKSVTYTSKDPSSPTLGSGAGFTESCACCETSLGMRGLRAVHSHSSLKLSWVGPEACLYPLSWHVTQQAVNPCPWQAGQVKTSWRHWGVEQSLYWSHWAPQYEHSRFRKKSPYYTPTHRHVLLQFLNITLSSPVSNTSCWAREGF